MKKVFSTESFKSAITALGLLLGAGQSMAQTGGAIFTAGPSMSRARIFPPMTALPDARVATFGGRQLGFISCEYADMYNPALNTFTEIPMNFPHDNTCVVKLFDGTYYIIGGSMSSGVAPGYSSCEIFDPASNLFITAGSMDYARMEMSAAQINNGHIVIAGAWYDNTAAGVGEYYDTSGHTYTLTGPLVQPCANPLMLPTTDGGAVLIGGVPSYGGAVYTRVEYYNPTGNTFSSLSSEIIPADPGWLVSGTPFHNRPYSDLKMADGKYLIFASRPGEYGLLTFDPGTKTFAKVATSTPLMDSFTNGGFYDFVLDKTLGRAYLLGVDSGYDPMRISLTTVDLATGKVYHPGGTFTLPTGEYPMPTMAFVPASGKILLEGISSTPADYFNATVGTYIIEPQPNTTGNNTTVKQNNVTCYPNPATDQLTFRFDNTPNGTVELKIYDIMGRMLINSSDEIETPKFEVRVGNLPSGLYYYEISNTGTVVRDKFLKE